MVDQVFPSSRSIPQARASEWTEEEQHLHQLPPKQRLSLILKAEARCGSALAHSKPDLAQILVLWILKVGRRKRTHKTHRLSLDPDTFQKSHSEGYGIKIYEGTQRPSSIELICGVAMEMAEETVTSKTSKMDIPVVEERNNCVYIIICNMTQVCSLHCLLEWSIPGTHLKNKTNQPTKLTKSTFPLTGLLYLGQNKNSHMEESLRHNGVLCGNSTKFALV